jgi:mannan endo-1,4-beta-mannosidase
MILAGSPQTVVSACAPKTVLPWVTVRKSLSGAIAAPYFELETGATFTPIGQNDAITWPELVDLLRRKNSRRAEAYIRMLADHSVTVLRLMRLQENDTRPSRVGWEPIRPF